jgi:hypothetical protein
MCEKEIKDDYVVGLNISEDMRNTPDWKLFNFNSPEEYESWKKCQRLYDPLWEDAQYDSLDEWNYDNNDYN